MAEFTTVGRAEDVPEGEMRVFEVEGEDVAVANVDGTLHAFGDVCTHQMCSLSEGDVEDDRVICPCHGSEFDVTTGDVMNPPATEPIPTYEISTEDGELRIRV